MCQCLVKILNVNVTSERSLGQRVLRYKALTESSWIFSRSACLLQTNLTRLRQPTFHQATAYVDEQQQNEQLLMERTQTTSPGASEIFLAWVGPFPSAPNKKNAY